MKSEGKIDLATIATHGGLIAILGFCYLIMLAPIIAVVLTSFSPPGQQLAGQVSSPWYWYIQLLSDGNLKSGLATSLLIALCSTFAVVLIGTPAALVIAQRGFALRGVIGAGLLSPIIFPTLITGLALLIFFQWMSAPIFIRLLLGHIVIAMPYLIRMVLVTAAAYDLRLTEAALIHGASPARAFLKVTLPVIKPGVVAGAVFAFIISLGEVNISLFLTGPGVTTLPIQILSQIQFGTNQVIIAVVSTVQIAIIAVAVLVLDRIFGISLIRDYEA